MSAQHKRHTRLPEDWDRSDPGLQFLYKQQRARERYIGIAETALLEERVEACYEREGVNHYANCRDLVKEYMDKCKNPFVPTPIPGEK